MSLGKLFRLSSVFGLALILGLGWVGLFRYFVSEFETQIPETSPLQNESVGHGSGSDSGALISVDDKSFTPPQVDEDNPDAFDPEGIYTVVGLTNPGFADFDSISVSNKNLAVDCDHEEFGDLLSPTGFVNFIDPTSREESSFELHNISIKNGLFSFSSETRELIRYEFVGEFLVKGNFYTLEADHRVLKGTMTKHENGRKVSETEVSFTWSIDLSCVC